MVTGVNNEKYGRMAFTEAHRGICRAERNRDKPNTDYKGYEKW